MGNLSIVTELWTSWYCSNKSEWHVLVWSPDNIVNIYGTWTKQYSLLFLCKRFELKRKKSYLSLIGHRKNDSKCHFFSRSIKTVFKVCYNIYRLSYTLQTTVALSRVKRLMYLQLESNGNGKRKNQRNVFLTGWRSTQLSARLPCKMRR